MIVLTNNRFGEASVVNSGSMNGIFRESGNLFRYSNGCRRLAGFALGVLFGVLRKLTPFYCLAVGVATAYDAVAQVSVYAKVDSMHLSLGDALHLHITVRAPEGTHIVTPRLVENSKIELIDSIKSEQTIRNGDLLLSQTWTITALDSGTWVLPPLPFTYVLPDGSTDTVRTQPINIYAAPMRADTSQTILPNAPIMAEPMMWRDALPWLLAILGVALVGYAVYWWLRRKKVRDIATEVAAATPLLPAHTVALRKLKWLSAQNYLATGNAKKHYSELTYILREYIDRRYAVATLEKTTDELLDTLRQQPDIAPRLLGSLGELWRTADLVKFAKAQTSDADNDRFMQLAIELVVQTTPPVAEDVVV